MGITAKVNGVCRDCAIAVARNLLTKHYARCIAKFISFLGPLQVKERSGLSCFPKSSDWARSCIPALALLACLAWVTADAAPSPTTEFDVPYQLRVESDSVVLEVSGSFSWALPQNVQAVLAAAPQVRVVRLESPGGHVLPAIQTANIIQQHGLDTYCRPPLCFRMHDRLPRRTPALARARRSSRLPPGTCARTARRAGERVPPSRL